jgi:quercetin dioxygenase-like cupin family protein
MAIPHAKPGDIVDVRPLGSALASSQSATLVRAAHVEVIRLVVPAGKEIAEHKAKGEIVVQCLEGRVAFTALGKTQDLEAGKLLYLPAGESHSVKGIQNASLLLTVLLPKH